jgi:hypothetical protein
MHRKKEFGASFIWMLTHGGASLATWCGQDRQETPQNLI